MASFRRKKKRNEVIPAKRSYFDSGPSLSNCETWKPLPCKRCKLDDVCKEHLGLWKIWWLLILQETEEYYEYYYWAPRTLIPRLKTSLMTMSKISDESFVNAWIETLSWKDNPRFTFYNASHLSGMGWIFWNIVAKFKGVSFLLAVQWVSE